MDLTAYIRDVPDFPKPGVLFKDITPLLADPDGVRVRGRPAGGPLRQPRRSTRSPRPRPAGSCSPPRWPWSCSKPLVPLRKPGKLPYHDPQLQVRPGVRVGRAAHPHRRRSRPGAGAAGGRRAGDRRDDGRGVQADRAGRRHRRRVRVPDRAGVPQGRATSWPGTTCSACSPTDRGPPSLCPGTTTTATTTAATPTGTTTGDDDREGDDAARSRGRPRPGPGARDRHAGDSPASSLLMIPLGAAQLHHPAGHDRKPSGSRSTRTRTCRRPRSSR